MFPLIYPTDPAEILPKLSAINNSINHSNKEMVPIVDDSGLVVAQATFDYIKEQGNLLYPYINFYIVNRFEEIYLVKKKSEGHSYSKWECSSSSFVLYGEEFCETLYRTVREQLNLVDFNPIFLDAYIRDNQYTNTFVTIGNFNINIQSDILEGKYWTIDEIEQNLDKAVFTSGFEEDYKRNKQKLLSLL